MRLCILILLVALMALGQAAEPKLITPTDLKAFAYGTHIFLSWTDTAIGEDKYWIQYRYKSQGPWITRTLAYVPENSTSYSFIGTRRTKYEFRIRACYQTQCSAYSTNLVALEIGK